VALDSRLSERDRQLTYQVARLRLLSHEQLRRLFFADGGELGSGRRTAQRRLARLVELGVLARLERRVGGVRAGSAGFVYGLGPAGQKLCGLWSREDAGRSRSLHEPGAPFVEHTLACSDVYVALVEAAGSGSLELLEHQAEPQCWRSCVGPYGQPLVLRPDGFVRLGIGERELLWFVEVDQATESFTAIRRQGRAYLDYYVSGAAGRVMPRVAWLAPDVRRADALRDALHELGGISTELFVAARQERAIALLSGGSS
jgi:hypothetical protein